MKKEDAKLAVLREYDRWAKDHPNDANIMGGFLFFRYLQNERSNTSTPSLSIDASVICPFAIRTFADGQRHVGCGSPPRE